MKNQESKKNNLRLLDTCYIINHPLMDDIVECTITDFNDEGTIVMVENESRICRIGVLNENVFLKLEDAQSNVRIANEEDFDVFGGMDGDMEPGFGED